MARASIFVVLCAFVFVNIHAADHDRSKIEIKFTTSATTVKVGHPFTAKCELFHFNIEEDEAFSINFRRDDRWICEFDHFSEFFFKVSYKKIILSYFYL